MDSTGVIIEANNIKTISKTTTEGRMKQLQIALDTIMNKYSSHINEIIIEDTYLFRNPKTKQLLDRIAGTVIALANIYSLKYRFITTVAMKTHILQQPIRQPKKTKGQSKPQKIDYKELQRLKIIGDYNLPTNTKNDITDAIGLCICGLDNVQ